MNAQEAAMNETHRDQRGLLEALMGDGRPVLTFMGLSLALCGGFALFQSATGHFLPHDAEYLGMDAKQLCAANQCRVVHFMFHDRVAFGGVLIALGLLYMWLAEFPLRHGEAWAWWAFAVSGGFGFASFLTYIGYGYLDTWHGTATLLLLPCFVVGLARSKSLIPALAGMRSLLKPSLVIPLRSLAGLGRVLLLGTALGFIAAGLTISILGATWVFVPQDVKYLGLSAADLHAINRRLVPLIAHDRSGFGGALCTCGILWLFCVWCGTPSRSLWQVLCASGSIGFAAAIGIHLIVGYIDFVHLAPAFLGALLFVFGIALSFKPMCSDAGLLARIFHKLHAEFTWLSLTPRFSGVICRMTDGRTASAVFDRLPKPLKRFGSTSIARITPLKRGVNEMGKRKRLRVCGISGLDVLRGCEFNTDRPRMLKSRKLSGFKLRRSNLFIARNDRFRPSPVRGDLLPRKPRKAATWRPRGFAWCVSRPLLTELIARPNLDATNRSSLTGLGAASRGRKLTEKIEEQKAARFSGREPR